MLRNWSFILVFSFIALFSFAIARAYSPDFDHIQAFRVDSGEIVRRHQPDGRTILNLKYYSPSTKAEDIQLYLPTHRGIADVWVNGRNFGHQGFNDDARISRRKLPTALRISSAFLTVEQPNEIALIQVDATEAFEPGPIYLGPASRIAPVVRQHFTFGPPMRWSIPAASVFLSLLTLLVAFLARSPASYLSMTAVFALQFGIELDDRIQLGDWYLREISRFLSLLRDLLIFYAFNLWFGGKAIHRRFAFYVFGVLSLILFAASPSEGAGQAIPVILFAVRTLMLCAYCSYAIMTSERTEPLEKRIALALFAVWMTSNLTYLLAYQISGNPLYDFLAAYYVNVSMVVALSLLVSGSVALEWKRYSQALGNQVALESLAAGHRLELDQRTRELKAEIERRAILEERQRFTRDMHDGIGGQLLSMLLKARRGGGEAISLDQDIEQSIHDLRLIVAALDAGGEGLSAALESFRMRALDQLAVAGISLEWQEGEEIEAVLLGPRETLDVLRVLQEALTNAIRHSGGDRVTVVVQHSTADQCLKISVSDNGRGMPDTTLRRGGLSNIEARIKKLGGTFSLQSGLGLALSIDIPCRPMSVNHSA